MEIVPVIDLMQGQVVRAVRGERKAYRPVVSALCDGSNPIDVARALCRHCDSTRLYVADLDALMGGAPQLNALRALTNALPELELWLDAGFTDATSARGLLERIGASAARIVPVFGSESLHSAAALAGLSQMEGEFMLSLDRRDGRRLDAAGCWEAPQHWPARVIVMTLERVGAHSGPDLDTLREVRARSAATRLIGAGGVRDVDDLRQAEAAGADAWLVASALHDGKLSALESRPASMASNKS
jgi:phosphoribosylformimino-5-aminoimidazole carboxamide ribotide isomerase